jgi:hypothetical protein
MADEIGVKCLPYEEMVYLADEDRYEQVTQMCQPNRKVFSISGTQVRDELPDQGAPAAFLVHPQGNRRDPQLRIPGAQQAGLLRLVYGPAQRRQEHHRRHPDGHADGARPVG